MALTFVIPKCSTVKIDYHHSMLLSRCHNSKPQIESRSSYIIPLQTTSTMIKASYTVMLISAITIVGPIIGIEATDSRHGALNSRRLYKQGVSRGKSFTLSPTEAHPKSRAPATVETDMPTYDFPSRSPTLSFDMWLLSSGPTSEPPFYTNLPTKTPSAEPQIDQMITSAPFAGSPTPKPTCNYSHSSSANTNYFSKASKAPSSLAVSPAGAGSRKPTKLAKTTKVPVVHTTTSDKPSTTPSEVNDVDQSLTESPSTSPSDINTIIISSSAPSILVKDGPASSAPSKHPVTLHPSKAPSTTSPTPSCKSTKWHPNIGFHVCSNRLDDYLASWATPEMRENYFHNSLEECCNAVFGTSACEYQDICVSPSPTVSQSLPEPTQVPSKVSIYFLFCFCPYKHNTFVISFQLIPNMASSHVRIAIVSFS